MNILQNVMQNHDCHLTMQNNKFKNIAFIFKPDNNTHNSLPKTPVILQRLTKIN